MTENRLRELFDNWQHALGLGSWSIFLEVGGEPEHDGRPVLFKCNRSEFYDNATITAHNGVLDPSKLPESVDADQLKLQGDAWLEAQVVHELLHLALRDIVLTTDLIREQLSPPVCEVWDSAFRRAEEAFVDKLATALTKVAIVGHP